jgi:pilus assembly protein Flp/PilA
VIPVWGAKHALRRESGQGMVEYALILALIALAAVVAMGLLGGQIVNLFNDLLALFP